MAQLVNGLPFTVHGSKKIVNCQLSTVNLRQWRYAYTLIEILIVMSLIGLAVGLITTSYLSFERRQRLKNAAADIKSNIRLAQNNAHSGNKGFGDRADKSDRCAADEILIGWFVQLRRDSSNYSIAGYCKDSSETERIFGQQTFGLPKDVKIGALSVGTVNILYRPLTQNATFHTSTDFIDEKGVLHNKIIGINQVTADLSGPSPYKYQIIIMPTGEVSDKQI